MITARAQCDAGGDVSQQLGSEHHRTRSAIGPWGLTPNTQHFQAFLLSARDAWEQSLDATAWWAPRCVHPLAESQTTPDSPRFGHGRVLPSHTVGQIRNQPVQFMVGKDFRRDRVAPWGLSHTLY
jgi:hypothetical protein